MPVRKITISLPEDLVAAVDKLAAEQRQARSRFIATILGLLRGARSKAEVKRRIEAFYEDPTNLAWSLDRKIPNATTRAAMRESRRMMKKNDARFSNAEALFKALDEP